VTATRSRLSSVTVTAEAAVRYGAFRQPGHVTSTGAATAAAAASSAGVVKPDAA
jgi:hypothetical protein